MSVPNLSDCGLPATSMASSAPGSAVVTIIGTSWNQLSPLPGLRPRRWNCARRYSTVFSSPALPGARPSNASEASTFTCSAKSAALISGTNAWSETAAGVVAGAVTAGVSTGARLQAASATAPARLSSSLRDIRSSPGFAGTPDSTQSPFYAQPAGEYRRGRSVLRCALAVVAHRGGAGDRADPPTAMHVQLDLAFEHQRAI